MLTFVCLGSGPSLTRADIVAWRRQPDTYLIAVNDAYRLAPEAVAIFAADLRWWQRSPEALAASIPLKVTFGPKVAEWDHPELVYVDRAGQFGISEDPARLYSGGHSGYAAINLAVQLGASRIVLLGYDFQPSTAPDGTEQHHFFGNHADGSHVRYAQWRSVYPTLVAHLAARGIALVNASRVNGLPGVPTSAL